MMGTKVKKKGQKAYPWAWSTRGFALGVNSLLLMQVSYYATESAGLSIGLVSALILVSKLFDGVTDLVAGFIIDKTKSRWGKARPYELFLIPTWILTIMLFSTPEIGSFGKACYFFVIYLLINAVCVTFLSSSEAVYLSRSTTDEGLRAKALAVAGILATLFPTVVSIILPILMNTWGKEAGGWTKIMLVFGVPFTVIGLIRFFAIKELPEEELKLATGTEETKESNEISLKETIRLLAKNKYIFILSGVVLFCAIINGMNSTVGSYFFTYYIGDLNQMSVVSMLGLISPFALILFPVAVNKIGGINFVRIGLVLAIIGNVIKFFAGKNMVLIMLGSFLTTVPGSSAILMIGSIFVIQCMDYGQWKTGVRIEGPVNSVYGFASKIGSGLANGLAGVILGAAGFVGASAVQTDQAITAIQLSYSIVPAILCVIMLVILHFYDLEKNEAQIKKELTEK